MVFEAGQFVVSRAYNMTLYGRVVGMAGGGPQLNITRFWRTKAEQYRFPNSGSPDGWTPYDRKAEAKEWYRLPSECKLYDFSKGPLYDARGEKYTAQEGK